MVVGILLSAMPLDRVAVLLEIPYGLMILVLVTTTVRV
jgi:hypothetical protein